MRVKFEQLAKRYGEGQLILKHINFDADIRSMAIIGPSGCGKSTLLRVIGGLIKKTSGDCYLGERQLPDNEKDSIEYRKSIGFVFQHSGLFNHLSALDNITLPLIKVHNWRASDAKVRAMELLERLGVGEQAAKRPLSLSGGQRQRVAIARAIAPKPDLLLLDEPTSALDPEYTTEVLDVVRELKEQGLEFIIVTHHMGFARNACDDLAFMHDGNILEFGPSSELFAEQKSDEFKRFLSKILEWEV